MMPVINIQVNGKERIISKHSSKRIDETRCVS